MYILYIYIIQRTSILVSARCSWSEMYPSPASMCFAGSTIVCLRRKRSEWQGMMPVTLCNFFLERKTALAPGVSTSMHPVLLLRRAFRKWLDMDSLAVVCGV